MNGKYPYLYFLILMIFSVGSAEDLLILDIALRTDHSVCITLQWENEDRTGQQSQIDTLRAVIGRVFPEQIKVSGSGMGHEEISVIIPDIRWLQRNLNCLDYRISASFFKEKYYFKLLLNSDIIESAVFRSVLNDDVETEHFIPLFLDIEALQIICHFPGRCLSTNMRKLDGSYFYHSPYSRIMSRGDMVMFESERFIPKVALTILLILLGLFWGVLILMRNIKQQKTGGGR